MKIEVKKSNLLIIIIYIYTFLIFLNYSMYLLFSPMLPYLNLLLSIYITYKSARRLTKKKVFFMILTLVYIFLCSIYNGNSFGAISAFITVFCVIEYFEMEQFNINFYNIVLFTALLYILLYFPKVENYYNNFINQIGNILNPNSLAFMIAAMYMLFFCIYKLKYKKAYDYRAILVWCVCLFMEYMLKSRTSMFVLFLYGILCWCIPMKIWKSKKIIKIMALIILFFGIEGPVIYVKMSTNTSLSRLIYQYTGKYMFTGREIIWGRFFDLIRNNHVGFLVGMGSQSEYLIGQGYSLHNAYLGIMLNFGIIGLILYSIFLFQKINKIYAIEVTEQQVYFFLGYLCMMIMSYSEVVLLTSYMVLFSNMMLGLAGNNNIKELSVD